MKNAYAILWHEDRFKSDFLYQERINALGAKFAPYLNSVATFISGYKLIDNSFDLQEGVYPGEHECRGYSPHALWHEESS